MLGSYVINVAVNSFPQKVASGFEKVFEGFVGARYTPIAYLGSQLVSNSTNHAILCEQNLVTATDVKGIALVILNEKAGDVRGETLSLVEIKTCLSDKGSAKLGGITIAPSTEISETAMKVFNKHFGGLLGATNKPFAVLATQIVNGVAYFFAVESTMFVSPTSDNGFVLSAGNTKSINIVKVYSNFDEIQTIPVLEGAAPAEKDDTSETSADETLGKVLADNKKATLKYAFNW